MEIAIDTTFAAKRCGCGSLGTFVMLDPVGSTTWHNRHQSAIRELADRLARDGVAAVDVMIVGPGAVTRCMASLLNDAARTGDSRLRRTIGDLARYADQILRRIPFMPLRSLEPVEVSRALPQLCRLIVVDRSMRILGAVARDLPDAECHCLDLSHDRTPVTADVVIAFNVVCRLERPRIGMAYIAEAVRPGGLLLMDDRSAEAHLDPAAFERVGSKMHRRRG